MSTYTYFSLDWKDGRKTCPTCGNPEEFNYVELMERYLQKKEGHADWTPFEDSTSWYDAEKDLKIFSLLHPGVLFILSMRGDSWTGEELIYARNGKSYWVDGEMTFPPFNEEKLL
jgi:hypothetical protein